MTQVNYSGEHDTGRGRSWNMWHDCPFEDLLYSPERGWRFFDDFDGRVDIAVYTATQATTGTFAFDDAAGGVVLADCGATTATQGINVQKATSGVGELFIPKAGSTIWAETRLKAADIATGPEFFWGLSVIDTTIIASSANSSANHIGFESVSDDGVLVFVSEKGGSRDSVADVKTLADDTWVKLGFKVYGLTKIEIYVDGVLFGTKVTDDDDIPIVEMTPSLVCQSGGTTDPIVHVDWWDYVQVDSGS